MQNQNQRMERLIRGLRDRTLGKPEEDPEYRTMCEAIDDYRCAGLGVGEADFGAVLDAIADLIEAHLEPSEGRPELLDRLREEGGEEYTRMEVK